MLVFIVDKYMQFFFFERDKYMQMLIVSMVMLVYVDRTQDMSYLRRTSFTLIKIFS
jgi:hypothetical protein